MYDVGIYIYLVTRFDSFIGSPILVINIILPQPEVRRFSRGYLPKYYVNDTAALQSPDALQVTNYNL